MKSNWIKYVFVVFIILILGVAIYIIRQDEEVKRQEEEYTASNQDDRVKELKLGIAGFDTINPILSKNKNVQNITKLIYEPLVNLSSDYKAEPALATEWAKDGNSYLIKLRENVRWSDGQAFTAEDVRFTIDRLKDSDTIYSANVQNVVGVDVIDDYTVRINLDSDVPFFEYNLTFPILSSTYYQGEDFATSSKNSSPVGTGMFKITDVQSSYITLSKNTSYWDKDKDSVLETITVNLYSSIGELYNSFKVGGIDLIATDNENIQDYIGTIGYTPREIKGREHTFLAFNMSNQYLSRAEVRKAISYSIDKDNINSNVLGGKCLTSSFPLDYGNWLYQSQDASSGYNTEQAKKELTDAGWTLRSSSWQKTENRRTLRIELNLLVRASDSTKVAVAQNIESQLEAQGILINIVQASDEQYNNAINNKDYDIALCSMTLSPSPNLDTFFGDGNIANYTNEEVTNLLNETKNTTDENVLKQDYQRLAEIYKTDMPYVSLYNNKYTIAYSSGLVGDITPTWFYQFYGIEGWYK